MKATLQPFSTLPESEPLREAVLAMKKSGGVALYRPVAGTDRVEWMAGDFYICAKVMRRLQAHSFVKVDP